MHGDAFLDHYGDRLSHQQRRTLHDLTVCRTVALGGHVEECDQCGHRKVAALQPSPANRTGVVALRPPLSQRRGIMRR
jgi:hypothetical protein